jgi:hypothetical protein
MVWRCCCCWTCSEFSLWMACTISYWRCRSIFLKLLVLG